MGNLRFNLVIGCVACTLWAATETGSLARFVHDDEFLSAPTRAEYLLHGPPELAGAMDDASRAELRRELADIRW